MSDDVDRGEALARSGRYTPAELNGQTDYIPLPPEPDEPYDPGPPGDGHADDGVTWWDKAVKQRAQQYKIEREARQRVDAEMRPAIHYPPIRPLDVLLAADFGPIHYRIDGVAPTNGRVLLVAQYKAGKTTLVGNLIRALVDGEPFLGHFGVNTPAQRLVLIDDEMSERTVQQWMRDQHIDNTAAVADVITLRGNTAALNLLDEECRAVWAQRLRDVGCDYLIIDCLRPVLDALGLDENRDVGRFLVAWDALMAAAAIPDAALVQHMGHANERARGDSRLLDWPDAGWKLVRENDDPASPRYFSAYGRDVNIAEGRLGFDATTRHLTYTAGSRHTTRVDDAVTAIIKVLAEGDKDGLSMRGIETALAGEHPRATIREALRRALSADIRLIGVTKGPRNAKLHHILHPCSECGLPVVGGGPQHHSCPSDASGLPDE
jgi:AAA domain